MKESHKFKITLTPITGNPDCRVEIDGKEVRVRSVTVRANETTTVILEVPYAHVEIEGEAYIDVTGLHEGVRRLEMPTSQPVPAPSAIGEDDPLRRGGLGVRG